MADNKLQHNSDEIDLGQLFQLIGKGFNKIFISFLRVFMYFKKNIFILLGLLVLGAGIGYGLSKISTKKLKTEVIVKPTIESKNYLYDVVDEIQANIKSNNIDFFNDLGLSLDNLKGYEISIKPIDDVKANSKNEMAFLELLQSFENTEVVADIVRAELQNKNSFTHRITFSYTKADKGQLSAKKIMDYINSNEYFDGLIETYRENATDRIEENKTLVKQVDEIITNYSKTITQNNSSSGTDRIVLDNQERVDITGLLKLKSVLIKEIESKKIELKNRTEIIKVVNFGKTQEDRKSFFGKEVILIPLILLGLFFLYSFVKYLNKKSREL